MIDRATIDKIMDATNIVDVVGEFVNLRKAGVNYKGLCPFHDDKTPSFMVSPAKQICHCFACGEGGNAVNFLMKHEQITYPEALRWLAKKYNIEIQERELTDEEKKEQDDRESMFIVNEWACQYFHDILLNNIDGQAIGKQYFRSRGIRDDIIKKFQLGFALTKRDALANEAKRKGFKEEYLVKTGLCYSPSPKFLDEPSGKAERGEDGRGLNEASSDPQPSNLGGLRDRFAGRAIFPWLNVSGKVVAFGGRKLDAATKGVQQKYVNSPDSEIYHKERELYGIYQAKKAIVKEDCVYMVEGYTDVIAMHQCGLENVVANSGTALSNYQIRLLHRFTPNIVLLYDGDEAGIHAALRGTDMLLQEGMNVKVLLLPDGDDPDSFARKHTAQQFKEYIQEHQTDFIQFKADIMLKGIKDPIKRAEAINSIVRSISVIPDPIVRSTYITDTSRRLEVDERTLITQTNKFIAEERTNPQQGTNDSPQPSTPITPQPSPLTTPQPSPTTLGEAGGEASIEKLLIQQIIRHGDEVVLEGLETQDGGFINMNVAQYVDYEFGTDGLSFGSDLYNRILREAVEHSEDKGFRAETYFTRHPDVEVSQLATRLAVDDYQLGRSFEMKHTTQRLRQQVEHLMLDFRFMVVKRRIKELKSAMKQPDLTSEQQRALMMEFMELNTISQQLSKMSGRT